MIENFTYVGKKDSPSQEIIHNHLQNCPNFLDLPIVFIVNKLNYIYFTWFVFTFVDYKYNGLLKRDNVCLMTLSTFVTRSRFDEGKEIRIICSKMA